MNRFLTILARRAALLVLLTGCATTSWAVTNFMTTTGNDGADGLTWGTAWLTFSNAVVRANNGDTVLVNDGTYQTAVMISNSKSITFQSVNGRDVTIVDANATSNDPRRVFYLSNAGAVLDGFTIRGGCTLGFPRNHPTNPPPTNCPFGYPGAGIYMTGGTVRNCNIASNITYWFAAGVYMAGGLVENCRIYSNEIPSTAHDGCCNWPTSVGGIYIGGAGATVQNCEIFGNIGRGAGWGPAGGGGVGLLSGKLLNSSIHHNELYGGFGGSGINMDTASGGLVSNCLVYGNGGAPSAGRGTGIFAGSGTIVDTVITNNTGGTWPIDCMNAVSLRNVLIANHPGQRAIRPWSANVEMDNCTLAGNSYGVDRNQPRTILMRNCIITNTSGAFVDSALSIVMSNCCSTTISGAGITATDCVNTDPFFVNAAGGDYRLKKKSPLMDLGLNLPWMIGAKDLDGRKRILGVAVDLGPYELPAPAGTIVLLR